jgi:hypothetical protein
MRPDLAYWAAVAAPAFAVAAVAVPERSGPALAASVLAVLVPQLLLLFLLAEALCRC